MHVMRPMPARGGASVSTRYNNVAVGACLLLSPDLPPRFSLAVLHCLPAAYCRTMGISTNEKRNGCGDEGALSCRGHHSREEALTRSGDSRAPPVSTTD